MKQQAKVFLTLIVVLVAALAGCTGEKKEEGSARSEAKSKRVHALTLSAVTIEEIGLITSVAEVRPIVGNMIVPAKLVPNQDFEAQVG